MLRYLVQMTAWMQSQWNEADDAEYCAGGGVLISGET